MKPLWLPEWSIRSLIALGLTGTSCYMVIENIEVPEWFVTLVVGTVGFYFGKK
jgi:hypothetical protein